MEFFQTGMGKEFYDGTMKNISRNLKSISESLQQLTNMAINESKQTLTSKETRYREMVNTLVDYISIDKTNEDIISILLDNGFTCTELMHELEFSEKEVLEVYNAKE